MIYTTTPKNFVPHFELVGSVIEYEGKILLLQRHESKYQGLRWGLPAGKRERNETIEHTLIREIYEETQNKFHPTIFRFVTSFHVNHYHDFVFYMYHTQLTYPITVTINPSEHQAYQWIVPQKVGEINLVEDLSTCLKRIY